MGSIYPRRGVFSVLGYIYRLYVSLTSELQLLLIQKPGYFPSSCQFPMSCFFCLRLWLYFRIWHVNENGKWSWVQIFHFVREALSGALHIDCQRQMAETKRKPRRRTKLKLLTHHFQFQFSRRLARLSNLNLKLFPFPFYSLFYQFNNKVYFFMIYLGKTQWKNIDSVKIVLSHILQCIEETGEYSKPQKRVIMIPPRPAKSRLGFKNLS